MGCLCPCFRAVLFIVKKKAAPHEAAFSPQRNPVPSHPLCPMSSVSAWSTAAAARGATARARHESPVISAVIDEEVTDFSAFSFYLIREGLKEVNPWTPAFHTCIPYGHLGNLWMTSFHSAGLSHPSTI